MQVEKIVTSGNQIEPETTAKVSNNWSKEDDSQLKTASEAPSGVTPNRNISGKLSM